MIRGEEVFYIGKVGKTHGLQGEVEVLFTDDVFDRGYAEYLVLSMDGIFVPYFWEEYRFKNDEIAIFKFQDIDSAAAARHLVGHEVYYPFAFVPTDEDAARLRSFKAFTGFTVADERGHLLGSIAAVDDSSANVLLTLLTPDGRETLVPLHKDLVTSCDIAKRSLCLRLPKGLLNLNH